MAQYGVPWVALYEGTSFEGAGTVVDWDTSLVRETPFDDATTQIQGGQNQRFPGLLRTRVSSPLYDPGVHTGHVVRARAYMSAAGIDWRCRVALYQGDGAGTYTLIAWNDPIGALMSVGWATYSHTLSTGEAGNITNYQDLALVVSFGNVTSGGTVWWSACELELPDAAPTDGAFSDTIELDGTFDGSIIEAGTFSDAIVLGGTFGARVGAGRLVPQGQVFRLRRSVLDMETQSVTIVGGGR